jgi:hypothetical protein
MLISVRGGKPQADAEVMPNQAQGRMPAGQAHPALPLDLPVLNAESFRIAPALAEHTGAPARLAVRAAGCAPTRNALADRAGGLPEPGCRSADGS